MGLDNISCMLCLDMCGFGERIALYCSDPKHGILQEFIDVQLLDNHPVTVVSHSENSDFSTFTGCGIPAISIMTFLREDMELMVELLKTYGSKEGIMKSPDGREKLRLFKFGKTCHNGEWDDGDHVKQETMDSVYNFVCDALGLD